LYDGQKQIVLTSDCPPREIPEIEERSLVRETLRIASWARAFESGKPRKEAIARTRTKEGA
jgi:hypothetical protein